MADTAGTGVMGLRAAAELVEYVEGVGVKKAQLPLQATLVLGVLAGMFIGLGCMIYTMITSDTTLSFAARQLLGGLSFCVGLVLVVVGGAELFTGNVLMAVAWAGGKLRLSDLLRNWGVVLLANLAGSVLLGLLVLYSGTLGLNKGLVAAHALEIAGKKDHLNYLTAFFSAVMCNILVCMAVWLAYAGRTVADKILAVLFPITTFVACGFEHSVADMYFLPLGLMLRASGVQGSGAAFVTVPETVLHLLTVILGNIIGGGLLVGLMYHWGYRARVATGVTAPAR